MEAPRVLISGHPPQPDDKADLRPSPPQRHRGRDRSHENRRPPVTLSAEGHLWRHPLRGPLRLRPQHPQDPRPPSGFVCLNLLHSAKRTSGRWSRSSGHQSRLTVFFWVNKIGQSLKVDHGGCHRAQRNLQVLKDLRRGIEKTGGDS